MKKISFSMMAAIMMFATSCQNDLDAPNEGATASVSFTIGTPEMASRAYSDGMTATKLQYAVYNAAGELLPALNGTTTLTEGKANVELQLTTGNNYSVIFWAAAEGAPYSVNFTEKKMTVNYESALSNDESRDAFYKYHNFNVAGAQTETIELKRPFAQLNIGTNDYTDAKKAGFVPSQSSVTVKTVYSTLDLWEGKVSEPVEITFATNDIKKDETFPVGGNEYLAMNYLLVSADKELVDVEFTYTDGSKTKTRTVGSVPVQRNYRTNIYGQLLTSDVDVNVEINPGYEEGDYEGGQPGNEEEKPSSQLEKLIQAAAKGGQIILTEDVVLTEPLYIQKDLIIGLNNHTISADFSNQSEYLIYVNGDKSLELYCGTISSTAINGAGVICCTGNLEARLVTFKQAPITQALTPNQVIYYHGINGFDSKLILEKCEVIGGLRGIYAGNGTITLNDTDFNNHFDCCIDKFGFAEIMVNGGVLTASSTGTIFNPVYTSIKVNYGIFNGQINNSGSYKLEFYGGSFTEDPSMYVQGDNKVMEHNGRFYVVNNNTDVVCTSPITIDDNYAGSSYSGEALDDPTLYDVIGYKNWYFTDDARINLERECSAVCFENVNGYFTEDFILNSVNNTVIFYNCNIILDENKKLIKHVTNGNGSCSYLIFKNVTINGEKITNSTAIDYIDNIWNYEVL